MRVALCFSGQLRNVKDTFDRWIKPHIIDANPKDSIDVFVHGWYNREDWGTAFVAAGGSVHNSQLGRETIGDVYECYNPISTTIEHQRIFDTKTYHERKYQFINPQFTLSKLYSINVANQLKMTHEQTHSFLYDLVISTRFDWGFRSPVLFEIAGAFGVHHPGCNPHGINVGWLMGDSNSMNTYANLFYDVEALYNTNVPFCDEILAEAYLRNSNIPIHNFNHASVINRG